MASSVDIVPALGTGLIASQTGPSAGYNAIDIRRLAGILRSEGVLAATAYKVSQRAAGANLSVDIAANVAGTNGASALVLGDSITAQALYAIAPHASVINVDIAAANATNPRNDLVILELKDDQHDVGGLNVARVRVVTGTANASAALTDALGANGTPSLPVSSLALAVVNVPALDTTIADAQISDRRTSLWSGGAGGKSIIATAEARTNTAYGTLTTPDIVRNIVLPTDGVIAVLFQAQWLEPAIDVGRAAIFLNAVQLQANHMNLAGGVGVQAARTRESGSAVYVPLVTCPLGLASVDGVTTSDPPTTGMALGMAASGTADLGMEVGGVSQGLGGMAGGPCYIWAAAGTYDISVQFKSASGAVTAKNRKLWVWAQAFG